VGSVLLYDAGCRLCRFAAHLVARVDGDEELAILPLQDPRAAPLVGGLPEPERLASWRIARLDGTLAGFGAGLVPLLAAMRRTRPLARLASRAPVWVLDAAYNLVARNRRLLGRLVPDVPPVVAPREGAQIAATSRASDSTESGLPDARATSRSQRTDSPGA
jgi:predicted DCC family thiol-disulfide oxidoreductase YuxK